MTSGSNQIRLFALNNLAIEAAVQRVERDLGVDLGHLPVTESGPDETYYPQFDEKIRREASEMSAHYRVFYCLENAIRSLITEVLFEKHNEDWWNSAVPESVKTHVSATQKKEAESGIAIRSQEPIDYTTFGELGEIIKSNWSDFTDIFQNIKALEKVIATLNVLRGPIAHCKPLAEDEVVRLHLSVRDWFRSMG
ncbi:Swt1 family HEPN domain-containing protein [Sphingopyxis sp. RIFCSPHIGHO2_12_FULL_65_19]|uniref:Swt1 family HEPN domain-containing protein n=1 Tax=Sphingopyxis sp. RIFCSPHIGHO2_12_FULL_65_19 TaxID=1802172 RepID=UPI000A3FB628|nr:Swt1 family HEPN domain-containing protein [Sphingopyxis sp. RIFCSPHIGHO2_12_FULL_65_19]